MFPLYQLPGLQLRADGMHENANSGCLTASQSTCCSPSQTTALFPALSDRHPLQLHLSWTFCIISVSMFPSFLIYAGRTGTFHQSSRNGGSMARIKVAPSGLNWPQSTLLITHYRVTNLPLSVTVVCFVEILIARINYLLTYFISPAPFILL